jgi:hypothetical protein
MPVDVTKKGVPHVLHFRPIGLVPNKPLKLENPLLVAVQPHFNLLEGLVEKRFVELHSDKGPE